MPPALLNSGKYPSQFRLSSGHPANTTIKLAFAVVRTVATHASHLSATTQFPEEGNTDGVADRSANEKVTEDKFGAEWIEDSSDARRTGRKPVASSTLTPIREGSDGRWMVGGGASSSANPKLP